MPDLPPNPELMAVEYKSRMESLIDGMVVVKTPPKEQEVSQLPEVQLLGLLPVERVSKVAETIDVEEPSIFDVLGPNIQDFIGIEGLEGITPKSIHAIAYAKADEDLLFPNPDGTRAGFHSRFGGYPVMFFPVKVSTEKKRSATFQPMTVGHELMEIIVTNLMRHDDSRIGIGTLSVEGVLKEGLCNIVGLDFYNYMATKMMGKEVSYTFDEAYHESLTTDRIGSVCSVPFAELGRSESAFCEYVLSASFLSHMLKTFSLSQILDLVKRKTDLGKEKDDEIAQSMRELQEKLYGSGIGISLNSGNEIVKPIPNNPQMWALLEKLGYTAEMFPANGISDSTPPVDGRVEGALAMAIVDRYIDLLPAEQYATIKMEGDVNARKRPAGPTFVQLMKTYFSDETSKEVLGEDFDIDGYMEDWLKKFDLKYDSGVVTQLDS